MSLPIGTAIRTVRQAKGISRIALAKRMGVVPIFVSKIELGRHDPTLKTLERFGDALQFKSWRLLRLACRIRVGQEMKK